jgi:hypothetical protein
MLMDIGFSTDSLNLGDKKIWGAFTLLENAVICLLWEGEEPKLGSLSITLPDRTSSQIIGERDQVLSKVVGGFLASSYGKMALVSVNLSRGAGVEGSLVLELVKKIVKRFSRGARKNRQSHPCR